MEEIVNNNNLRCNCSKNSSVVSLLLSPHMTFLPEVTPDSRLVGCEGKVLEEGMLVCLHYISRFGVFGRKFNIT